MNFEPGIEQVYKYCRTYNEGSLFRTTTVTADFESVLTGVIFGTENRTPSIGVYLAISCILLAACGNSEGKNDKPNADTEEQSTDASQQKSVDASYVPPDGDPIEANDFEWTWVDVPEAICRNGSPTGFAVNLNSASNKVMLYYEGGGACYNMATCMVSPSSATATNYIKQGQGVFNREREDNPVKDWNFVYFPYCSGDVFAGNNESNPGIGEQQFYGYRNVGLFLDRVVSTVTEVTHVFATGVSAGAIGVGVTVELIADKFSPSAKFSTVVDSCPPMDAAYVSPCLQRQWCELWGFDKTILASCGSDCPDPDNFMVDMVIHLLNKYQDRDVSSAVLTSTEDPLIRFFYGFGNNDCNPENALMPSMPPEKFSAGVMDLRSRLKDYPQFGTFYFDGQDHTWMNTDAKFYELEVDGIRLVDWVRDLIEGDVYHVGP